MNKREYLDFIRQWKKENKELIENGKCKKVFIEILPKRGKKCISWINSVGYKVHFIYNDIEDDLEIIDYCNKEIIKIKYQNNCTKIGSNKLKCCHLGDITGKVTKNFKVKIGQTFKDNKRDLTIINREHRKDNKNSNLKYYKYHCNKCGNEDWIEESSLLISKCGCNRCCIGGSNKKVDKTNCLATTHPELMKYLVNKEDGYKYSYGSGKKILCKCPDCGFEKEMIISNLTSKYKNEFTCPKCGDGTSYPEKIMFNLLKQLNIKNIIPQYSKINTFWCDRYRYDFYFKYNNEKYIIETNGEQHYKDNKFKKSVNEQINIDNIKKELAIKNGIKAENYIVIDCRYSKVEYIKNNILKSRLNDIFDLDNINWIEIDKQSQKSLVKEICDYWHLHNDINNEGLSTGDILKKFDCKKCSIIKYLKLGTKFGWCNYNPKEEMIKSGKRSSKILKDNNIYKKIVLVNV